MVWGVIFSLLLAQYHSNGKNTIYKRSLIFPQHCDYDHIGERKRLQSSL